MNIIFNAEATNRKNSITSRNLAIPACFDVKFHKYNIDTDEVWSIYPYGATFKEYKILSTTWTRLVSVSLLTDGHFLIELYKNHNLLFYSAGMNRAYTVSCWQSFKPRLSNLKDVTLVPSHANALISIGLVTGFKTQF